MKKRRSSKVLCSLLVCLIIASMFGALPSTANAASKFNIGDTVEVYNTGGSGLYVRDAPCGNVIGGKFDGDRGVVLDGPVYCNNYERWLIRWTDGMEGWSAEDWLRKVSLPDLTVYDIQVDPNPPTAGGSTTVGITIRNQGDGDAVGTFFLEYYFDSTYKGHVYVNGLNARASYSSTWRNQPCAQWHFIFR